MQSFAFSRLQNFFYSVCIVKSFMMIFTIAIKKLKNQIMKIKNVLIISRTKIFHF